MDSVLAKAAGLYECGEELIAEGQFKQTEAEKVISPYLLEEVFPKTNWYAKPYGGAYLKGCYYLYTSNPLLKEALFYLGDSLSLYEGDDYAWDLRYDSGEDCWELSSIYGWSLEALSQFAVKYHLKVDYGYLLGIKQDATLRLKEAQKAVERIQAELALIESEVQRLDTLAPKS